MSASENGVTAASDASEEVVVSRSPRDEYFSDASTHEHVSPRKSRTSDRWATMVDEAAGNRDVLFQIRQLQDVMMRFQLIVDQSNTRFEGELQRLRQTVDKLGRGNEELRGSRDMTEGPNSKLRAERSARQAAPFTMPVLMPRGEGFVAAKEPAWQQAHGGRGSRRRRGEGNGQRGAAGPGDARL